MNPKKRENDLYLEYMNQLDIITLKELYQTILTGSPSAAIEQQVKDIMRKIVNPRKDIYLGIMKAYLNSSDETFINEIEMNVYLVEDFYFLNTIIPGLYLNFIRLLLMKKKYELISQFTKFSIRQSNNQYVKK